MTLQPNHPRRKKFVESLRCARCLIEAGQEKYLCLALRSPLTPHSREADLLREWIRDALENHYTVSDWMTSKAGYRLTATINWKAYRLQWIDHMIEYFS
jgi:hypothetical protein